MLTFNGLIPTSYNSPVPISYRGALLSTLLHVSLIPTRHNRPSAYQLQRSATEHSSTCKSHSHKPQQAQYLSVTEERYWALFYMFSLILTATTGLVPIIYRRTPLSSLLYASLILTSHNRPSTYQLQRSATEHSTICHCINLYTTCWIYLYRFQIK
jgi:hypothetical protein